MPPLAKLKMPALAAAALLLLLPSQASAYGVICKHGKYDIDGRSEEQLKIAFGTSYCTLRRFSFRSDAESFAKNNNMQAGRACSCR